MTVSLAIVGMLLFGIASYAAGEHRLLSPASLAAADDCQTFSQTGKTVCGDFLKYWQDHGGLAQQGYPISDVFDEKSETDGITHKVQYFERAVFEAHPENAPPNNVLLSLLGSQKYKARYGDKPPTAPQVPPVTPASKYPLRMVKGSLAITLYEVRDPAPADTPKAGTRIVALDVTMENVGSTASDYNAFEWAIQTSDDRIYEASGFPSSLRPYLTSGTLAPGEKARGWISISIPQGSSVSTAKYADFGTNPIAFPIG